MRPFYVILVACFARTVFAQDAQRWGESRWEHISLPGVRSKWHLRVTDFQTSKDSVFLRIYSDIALGEDFLVVANPESVLSGVRSSTCIRYTYLGRQGETVVLRRESWRVILSDRESRSFPSSTDVPANRQWAMRAERAFSSCELSDTPSPRDTVQLYVPSSNGTAAFTERTLRLDGVIAFKLGPATVLHEASFIVSR
jgi:hypothetical protein